MGLAEELAEEEKDTRARDRVGGGGTSSPLSTLVAVVVVVEVVLSAAATTTKSSSSNCSLNLRRRGLLLLRGAEVEITDSALSPPSPPAVLVLSTVPAPLPCGRGRE